MTTHHHQRLGKSLLSCIGVAAIATGSLHCGSGEPSGPSLGITERTGTYSLTPSSGAPYVLEDNFNFHSTRSIEGGCAEAVWDRVPILVVPSFSPNAGFNVGFGYFQDDPGQTCGQQYFGGNVSKSVGTKSFFEMTGTWSQTTPKLMASGNYQAFNASGTMLETGTFTFVIDLTQGGKLPCEGGVPCP